MTSKKRVVITGMGIVSSIGNNLEEVKVSLINQKSGIVKSDTYREMGFRSQIHGEVKLILRIILTKKNLGLWVQVQLILYFPRNKLLKIQD